MLLPSTATDSELPGPIQDRKASGVLLLNQLQNGRVVAMIGDAQLHDRPPHHQAGGGGVFRNGFPNFHRGMIRPAGWRDWKTEKSQASQCTGFAR